MSPEKCISSLEQLSKNFDYAVVVAPPKELIEITKALHAQLLQPSPQLTEMLSNKYKAIQSLRGCGVMVPDTRLANVYSGVALREAMLPVVVKPTLLTGAACVEVAKDSSELNAALQSVAKCSLESDVVVQEFVEGVHGSILAFYSADKPLFYSANLQFIGSAGRELKFFGGLAPLRSKVFKDSAEAVVTKVKKCFPRLYGFVGMDIVWSSGKPFVVEVNPRPTTSIVPLAKLLQKLPQGTLKGMLFGDSALYAGDAVMQYSYYVKSKRGSLAPLNMCEEVLSFPQSEQVIVVGEVENPLPALDRVKSLVGNLVYDLSAVLLAEAQAHGP